MNTMTFSPPVHATGLTADEAALVDKLLKVLEAKRRRNWLRSEYYDGRHALAQISRVVPESYHRLGIVLGWTGKAVDLLARRCNLEGFDWSGGDLEALGVDQLLAQNRFQSEAKQAITSMLLHSCAFAIAHKGGPGEPEAMIHFKDALSATGEWDARARRLTSLLSVTGRDDEGKPDELALYLDDVTIDLVRVGQSWEVVERRSRPGTVPAEVLTYRARLGRPFGSSRISRSMMALQDQAVRELVRLEGHMDVYSWPEFWMLGADESVFTDANGQPLPRWQVMLGRIKGIPDDDDAANPRADIKHFPASSPEPHLAAINAFAKLFSREASLPDTALAIASMANPTSAESYDASQYELIAEAEGATADCSPAMSRIVARALAIAHGQPENEPPSEWATIVPTWRDPRFQSKAAMADAGQKMLSAVPWLAETKIGLSRLGLSAQEVDLALAERRRMGGSAALEAIRRAAEANRPTVTVDPDTD